MMMYPDPPQQYARIPTRFDTGYEGSDDDDSHSRHQSRKVFRRSMYFFFCNASLFDIFSC